MGVLEIFGVVLMLGAIGFTLFLAKRFFRKEGAEKKKTYVLESDQRMAEVMPTDTLGAEVSSSEKLKVVKAKQTVSLLGDERDREVLASVTLCEMTQRSSAKNAPWVDTGVHSKAIALTGGIWIFKIPSREAGKPLWIKAREVDSLPLQQFYKGGDVPHEWGPARKFKESKQSHMTDYELPGGLTPGVIWQIVDIGRFKAIVDGSSDIVYDGDGFPFVTSREKGGGRWLLYLDSRKGIAKGSGGLFVGEPFEPSVDVAALL